MNRTNVTLRDESHHSSRGRRRGPVTRPLYVRRARSASAAEIVEAIGLVKPRHACTLFVEIWLPDRDSNPEPCG